MGGNATFSGTTYQAGVIAYIYVHVLGNTKLRWLSAADDTPTAIAAEVGGPGDDARIEFGTSMPPVEVQAKHGLKGYAKLKEVITKIRDSSVVGDMSTVVVAIDSSSSQSIRFDFRRDIERLRSNRTDELKEIARNLLSDLGEQIISVLRRIRIITLDLETLSDSESQRAVELLADSLEVPGQAETAWAILKDDASQIAASKGRRTRSDLVALLAGHDIKLLPQRKTRRWHADLRLSKKALLDEDPATALSLLKQVENELTSGGADASILYRLNQHRAAAYLQLERFADAITFARRALDHEADGIQALTNLANGLALAGEAAAAKVVATTLRERHPDTPTAWIVSAQVATLAGEAIPTAPPSVAETPEYRRDMTRLRIYQGELVVAREMAAELLREGDRSNEVLALNADALLSDIDEVGAEESKERAERIVSLSSEIIDSVAASDRMRQRALVARSSGRRLLGKFDEAHADIEEAQALDPDDPHVLLESVQTKIHDRDEEGALALLTRPVVDEKPFLLATRATLLAGKGEEQNARRDIDAALRVLARAPKQSAVLSAAAEAAIRLKDIPLAKRLLNEAYPTSQTSTHHLLMLGRIAVIEGNIEEAEQKYREAADQSPAQRADFFVELGAKLLEQKHTEAAVRVFEDANPLPHGAERPFALALVSTKRLGDALALLERTAVNGVLPDWAVGLAAQIASRRNDALGAVTHLEELVARDKASPAGRLALAEALLGLDQTDRALAHLDAICTDEELDSHERMMVAQLLKKAGRNERAINNALHAYREAPDDPAINRAFVGVVLGSHVSPGEVSEIGANTYALLVDDSTGQRLEYLVFDRSSVGHPLRNEISLSDAKAVGLIGLRVGELFRQHTGTWYERRWRVERVESVVKYVLNYVLSGYSTRFPNQSFFATEFKVDPETLSITDLYPMIASAQDRERQSKQIVELYREKVLPLSMVAGLTGTSVPEVMRHLSQSESGAPLYVEWSDEEGARVSRSAARDNKPVVLTRSALFSLDLLGLTATVSNVRQFIAPRALRDELREELRTAEDRVKHGFGLLSTGQIGLSILHLEAGSEVLVATRDSLQRLIDWTQANVDYRPRPLEAFGKHDFQTDEGRSQLGESSSDALELARYGSGTLYADDLGLRGMAVRMNIPSFSSVAFVQVLSEAGVILQDTREQALMTMIEQHYVTISPSAELFAFALAHARNQIALRNVFSLLADATMTEQKAARILISVIKTAAIASIQTIPTRSLTRLGLDAMALRFPASVSARSLSSLAERELALLPRHLLDVKHACSQFVKNKLELP